MKTLLIVERCVEKSGSCGIEVDESVIKTSGIEGDVCVCDRSVGDCRASANSERVVEEVTV